MFDGGFIRYDCCYVVAAATAAASNIIILLQGYTALIVSMIKYIGWPILLRNRFSNKNFVLESHDSTLDPSILLQVRQSIGILPFY